MSQLYGKGPKKLFGEMFSLRKNFEPATMVGRPYKDQQVSKQPLNEERLSKLLNTVIKAHPVM